MRDHLTTALEVVGAVTIVVGAFTLNLSAGLISAGLAAIGIGFLEGRQ